MRNLKKVLALALATVMLLGMMAMASAKGYADENVVDAKYDVAVDVMQAIGVFEGTKVGEDTYLYPTNTLTRAEAAKVITYIAMTKANASKLGTAEAPFADVAADHWAAGSIAYAKQLGIVSGVGEDSYAPNGTLTGYQFAKMLLVVLGYKAENQGYTGANWSTNVNADALTAGLLKGLAIDLAANITREQAAQMAFNALQAKTASYAGNTSITIGDVVLAVGGSVQVHPTQTLAMKLYPTLVKSAAAKNTLGYDVYTWTYGTKEVCDQPAYTVLATYAGTAGSLTKGAVYNIFGAEANYNVYVNDNDVAADFTVEADKGSTAAAGLAAYAGATVEFVKTDAGVKEVVITAPVLTTVTTVTAATATADRTVTLANGKVLTTEAYAKDQYVLVYLGTDGNVVKHEAAPSVYGTMTQATKKDGAVSTLYVDGVAVPTAGANVDVDARAFADGNLNKKYTVYTFNGYAIKVVADAPAAATLSNVVYVYGGGQLAGTYAGGTGDYEVKVVYMDGTLGTLKAEAAEFGSDFTYSAGTFTGAGLYKFEEGTTNDGGKKVFTNLDGLQADKDAPVVAFGADMVGAHNKTATQKAITLNGDKAYWTERTQVLTITNTNGVYSAALSALPTTGTFNATTYVIYTETKAGSDVFETELVVTLGAPAVTTTDLYYAIGTEVGEVYVAAADKIYSQYNVYEVATGAKKTVLATRDSAPAGFKSLTKVDENGVYTFGTATMPTNVAFSDDLKIYGNMISTVSDATIVDADVSEAVIVNTTATTGLTLEKLYTGNATVTGYAIFTSATSNKIAAIVVTGFTAAT